MATSPRSFKAQRLGAWLAAHHPGLRWCCPQLPPSPREAMALARELTASWPLAGSAVVGSSLGGFYAMALAEEHGWRCVLLNPAVDPAPYDASSLIPDAPKLSRPLLLVHGLADDNVVAAHTLLLSSALLAAGKPHEVLPLSGVTHMTPQVVVAENLLLHQLDFLRRSLG